MAGMTPDAVDMASIYDCFTITVLLSLENAGFCAPGQGQAFVRERNLHADGDFPLNTHGGQLSAGQPGHAGALSHVIDAVRQLQGRAGSGQVPHCNRAYCNGNGGMMAEHVVLLLEGE
jgi:acetyl-CoA acetyltransferase